MASVNPTCPSTVTGIVTMPDPLKLPVAVTVSAGENWFPSETTSMPGGATMPPASTAALTWSCPQTASTVVTHDPGNAVPEAVPCHVYDPSVRCAE